ncbi:hypothetical protein D3C81_1181170 [compost metagenome]
MAQCPRAQGRRMAGQQRRRAEQRQRRHLPGQSQGQLDARRTTTEDRQWRGLLPPGLPAGNEGRERLDREQFHARPLLLGRPGQGPRIQRQPAALQRLAGGQPERARVRRQCRHRRRQPLHACRRAERWQGNAALLDPVAARQQSGQHAGIPDMRLRADQRDAPARALAGCPQAQDAQMDMPRARQEQIEVRLHRVAPVSHDNPPQPVCANHGTPQPPA